jgi:hypothetical protein
VDYAALAQMAISLYGEEQAAKLSKKQLQLLERQLNDVRSVALPTLEELKAEELGESNVGNMRSDESLRSNQLQAIATLQNIIDKGGLDLTDRAALEEALSSQANASQRARAGVAADAAQRGQLNSGSRLVMDMNAAQVGANAARKTGTEVAAQAQQRRLQAIREAAGMSGGLREQDWRESEAANRAKDIRDERNAAARERAAQYNAGLAQQGFNNAMAKAIGQLPSTSAVGNVLGGQAQDTRALYSGLGAAGNQAVSAYSGKRNDGSQVQTYLYDRDSNNFAGRGSPSDISDPDDK